MDPKWSLRNLLDRKFFKNSFLDSSFLKIGQLSLFSLFVTSVTLTDLQATDDYDALLMTENTIVSLCGELNFKRQSRNCIDATNLKHCLDLNHRDPLYVYQEDPSYSCVNTSYSAGVNIIRGQLEESEKMGGCFANNFRNYYSEVVDSHEFLEISRRFEEGLGSPLKLNYGVDTKDGLFNLQLDTQEIEGPGSEMVNISIGSFSEKGHCQKLSAKEVMAKITDEYNRLTLKVAKKDYDYYGDENPMSVKVFDASRFEVDSTQDANQNSNQQPSDSRTIANAIDQ